MNIFTEESSLEISQISLGNPGRLQGGSYYSRITYQNKPLYLQTSKCDTKSGIVTTGKKTYCDLMFHMFNNEKYIDLIFNIEDRIKKVLLEKSDIWFNETLDLDDIEYFFNSSFRTYKTQFQLMRTYVPHKSLSNLKIYNEEHILQPFGNVKKNVICVLHMKGVKFTNQSVHVDIELKQVMLVNNDEDTVNFDECLISRSKRENRIESLQNNIKTAEAETLEENETLNTESSEKASVDNDEDTEDGDNSNNDEDDEEDEDEEIETSTETSTNHLEETDNTKTSQVTILQASDNENISTTETDNNDSSITLDITDKSKEAESSDNEREIIEDTSVNLVDSSSVSLEDLEKNIDLSTSHNENNSFGLEEISLEVTDDEPISLKQPNEVYYEIYRHAREKAKRAKQAAIIAYLEAKNIKQTYMLDSDNESDSSLEDLETLSVDSSVLNERN